VFKTWLQRRLIDRCALFATQANTTLQATVTATAAALGRRVALAVPAFGPKNALFAPDSFLWGVGISTSGLAPFDPVAGNRATPCGTSDPLTTIASIGHPNARGAQAYATAIESVLPRIGF